MKLPIFDDAMTDVMNRPVRLVEFRERLSVRMSRSGKVIKMISTMRTAATCVAFLFLTVGAKALDTPAGGVILTVRGAISNTNAGETAQFDPAMLRALPGREARLNTPWIDGETGFSGPLLRAILDEVGATGSKLVIRALNDYAAEVPVGDATDFDTILAIEMNGEPMSVRDKGPLFLIYPFDSNPELYNEKYFSRSVWQIREIEVVK